MNSVTTRTSVFFRPSTSAISSRTVIVPCVEA
jgi:hypothetical protein